MPIPIIGGIASFFGSMFSSKKAVESTVDGVIAGIDKIFYTEEEKAEHKIATQQLILRVIEASTKENSVKSITRRFVAWSIIFMSMALTIWIAVLWTLGKSVLASKMIELLKFWSVPLSAVVIFYFGYYAVTKIQEKRKE